MTNYCMLKVSGLIIHEFRVGKQIKTKNKLNK